MNIYAASRFSRRHELRRRVVELEAAGHRCTSRWLGQRSDVLSSENARRDLRDIDRCSVLMLFGHAGRNAGCIFEAGYAFAKHKRVIQVARERGHNIFLTQLPEVEWYPTFEDALAALTEEDAAVA